jgi:energy-coupling factor transporter ATP-binding protein EcfA2
MIVRLQGLVFRYPGAQEPALRGVTAEFWPRDITVVTGRLGAGCSTLLLAIAGLAPRATGGEREGDVTTLGCDPASAEGRLALAGDVGLLFPTPWTQLSGMAYTVWDEVAFTPANLGWSRDQIGDAVDRSLRLLDVEHLAARDPRTLSGGELQRVMLAAVAVTQPRVYLLDEPTLQLDPAGAAAVYALLPALAGDAAVIVATTDVDRAVEVADRVMLLDDGRVIGAGAPDDVLGGAGAVTAGVSTTVAEILRAAECPGPYPLTVSGAQRLMKR